MQFLFRTLTNHRRNHHRDGRRSLVDFAAIKHVRDRGLDHAVHREKNLRPMLNIKNLIKSEPSKSLPISIITQQKYSLQIPTRPIEFVRKYPSIFEEFHPAGIGIIPHIKLTQKVLDLDSEERIVYDSVSYKQSVADRLLKLLMICRVDRLPLKVVDLIRWDLGLPQDYVDSVVPEFPDYFRVVGGKNSQSGLDLDLALELVCWSDELAVSVAEKRAGKGETVWVTGGSLAFPMKFSNGFEMDKKVKKWFSKWQKLAYVSPYENAMHLGPTTDESDKWAVGVLHELLHLFVSKKVERDTLLYLGDYLGMRSRFKKALVHHAGIFYLSSKLRTYTVVLKEEYKRGVLIERNPIMDIRNQYLHLMNSEVEGQKATSAPKGNKKQERSIAVESEGKGEEDDDVDDAACNYSESDFVDESDSSYESDESDVEQGDVGVMPARINASSSWSRVGDKKQRVNAGGHSRNDRKQGLLAKGLATSKEKYSPKASTRQADMPERFRSHPRSQVRSGSPNKRFKSLTGKRSSTSI